LSADSKTERQQKDDKIFTDNFSYMVEWFYVYVTHSNVEREDADEQRAPQMPGKLANH
jgi:hypothetical protein